MEAVRPLAGLLLCAANHSLTRANGGGFTSPAAVAGYPHVTVPAGFVQGLPCGLSFVGTAWSEPRLIALAYAFEQASHARRAPTFARTVNGW